MTAHEYQSYVNDVMVGYLISFVVIVGLLYLITRDRGDR